MSFFNPDAKSSRIVQLLQDLEHKNQHIKTLRSKLPTERRGSQRVERSIADAHSILLEAFKTGQTGRDHMLKAAGMKRSAWKWAVSFLRCAGIVAQRNPNKKYDWQKGLEFLVTDRDEAFARHKQASLEFDGRADGYQLLRRMWVYGFLPQGGADIHNERFVQAKGVVNAKGAEKGAGAGAVRPVKRGTQGRGSGPRAG